LATISQTAEYALRAVVHLASLEGQAQTAQQIAEATQVPAGYLSKVLQSLARGGVVLSRRGLGGGFTLARPPKQLKALEVINAVDPIRRVETCPLGRKEHSRKLCPLHRKLDEAIAKVERAFATSSIADLVE
jgi:Rrf2 family protein